MKLRNEAVSGGIERGGSEAWRLPNHIFLTVSPLPIINHLQYTSRAQCAHSYLMCLVPGHSAVAGIRT